MMARSFIFLTKIIILAALAFFDIFALVISIMASDGCGTHSGVDIFCDYFIVFWALLGVYYIVTFVLNALFMFGRISLNRRNIALVFFCTPISFFVGPLLFSLIASALSIF